jgi:hypothetical protein
MRSTLDSGLGLNPFLTMLLSTKLPGGANTAVSSNRTICEGRERSTLSWKLPTFEGADEGARVPFEFMYICEVVTGITLMSLRFSDMTPVNPSTHFDDDQTFSLQSQPSASESWRLLLVDDGSSRVHSWLKFRIGTWHKNQKVYTRVYSHLPPLGTTK